MQWLTVGVTFIDWVSIIESHWMFCSVCSLKYLSYGWLKYSQLGSGERLRQ